MQGVCVPRCFFADFFFRSKAAISTWTLQLSPCSAFYTPNVTAKSEQLESYWFAALHVILRLFMIHVRARVSSRLMIGILFSPGESGGLLQASSKSISGVPSTGDHFDDFSGSIVRTPFLLIFWFQLIILLRKPFAYRMGYWGSLLRTCRVHIQNDKSACLDSNPTCTEIRLWDKITGLREAGSVQRAIQKSTRVCFLSIVFFSVAHPSSETELID